MYGPALTIRQVWVKILVSICEQHTVSTKGEGREYKRKWGGASLEG
jgi:hypothetical protein